MLIETTNDENLNDKDCDENLNDEANDENEDLDQLMQNLAECERQKCDIRLKIAEKVGFHLEN